MRFQLLLSILALAARSLTIPGRPSNANSTSETTALPSVLPFHPGDFESIVDFDADKSTSESPSASPATPDTPIAYTNTSSKSPALEKRHPWAGVGRHGHFIAVHFASWIPSHFLDELPWHAITHVLYYYARVDPDGTVVPGAPDTDKHNMIKINSIKRRYRHVKVFYTIGRHPYNTTGSNGPGHDPQFDIFNKAKPVMKEDPVRDRFAASAVALMQDWGCDGFSIEWDRPTKENRLGFWHLAKATRLAVDTFEAGYCRVPMVETGPRGNRYRRCRFWLCMTTGWGDLEYQEDIEHEFDAFWDLYFYRGWDFSGPQSNLSAHHANLRGRPTEYDDPVPIVRSSAEDMKQYWGKGFYSRKFILGIPLYGRSFIQEGASFGVKFTQSNESDIVLNRDIKDQEWDCGFDPYVIASWCHDGTRLISYDSFDSIQMKAQWVARTSLGGILFNPIYGDLDALQSLIQVAWEILPTQDGIRSRVDFPGSRYAEIRGLGSPTVAADQ